MASIKKPKLLVIDGNALIHRSFHALPATMTTKSGEMTNAIYGFIMVLLKALKELKPEYVALTLDKKDRTFRHAAYEQYKAHRAAAPMELYKQIPRIKEVSRAFGIPIYEMSGYEADDLIGTIVQTVDGAVDKIIVTGDLDTLQLVNPHTKVYTMSHGLSDNVIYDEKKVKERFLGLVPAQMVDYKALRGDPSDNIPGVPGVGEKTAIELLLKFKTLDGVYKYLEGKKKTDKIKPRIAQLLAENKKQAYLSQKLARIECRVKTDFSLANSKFGRYDKEKLVQLLSELEFKSLLPKIREIDAQFTINQGLSPGGKIKKDSGGESGQARAGSGEDKFERNKKLFSYRLIDDEKEFEKFVKELKKQKIFAIDTETSEFDPHCSLLLGVSFSWKEKEAYFVKVKNVLGACEAKARNLNLFDQSASAKEDIFPAASAGKKGIELEKIVSRLKPILNNPKIKKVGQNIKFDYKILKAFGMEMEGIYFDTMIASYILNPGTRQHGLDALAFSEFGFEKISKEELLGKGKNKISFSQISAENLSLYSCEDADFTARLAKKLEKELKAQDQIKLFFGIEMPIVQILADMELTGVKIDTDFLKAMGKNINRDIEKLEEKILKLAGKKFNISSTQQLKEVLFVDLGISTAGIGRTKTGISTSADELIKMRDRHPIIPLIMEYRELTKLESTYIRALPELITKPTGRLHTSFNQAITSTGRLSSTEPNLQNIPIRTELGREIRKAFIAEKGCRLLSLDYSQIELRLAAHVSGDKVMTRAFRDGLDIHKSTAAEINQVKLEEVTPQMRREAKATNFGILYGQGPHGLSQNADIPYDRAKEFIDKYFAAHTGIKKYIEDSLEKAKEKGYAETMFGRKRYLPEINSSVMQIKKAAERMAINTPLQGAAADIMKLAMIKVAEALPEVKIKNLKDSSARMLLQVHDELLFEVREDEAEKWAKIIKDIMENVVSLKIPIEVEAKVGKNWGEMEVVG
ncbi:MAG: DNA polymerase I [Patescibacteria group bacterium]|jgi:DNA polymerase-1